MSEEIKLAFQFAADATKQLIIVSTAVLTFTVTFSKDVVRDKALLARNWLFAAWICLFLSICFGLWTLLGLTGELGGSRPQGQQSATGSGTEQINSEESSMADETKEVAAAVGAKKLSIYGFNVTFPSSAQIVCFLLGLILTVIAGGKSLGKEGSHGNHGKHLPDDGPKPLLGLNLEGLRLQECSQTQVQVDVSYHGKTHLIDEIKIQVARSAKQSDPQAL